MADDLSELEAKVNEAFAGSVPSHGDAEHMFYALTEAIHQLGAKPVEKELREQFPWYAGLSFNEEAVAAVPEEERGIALVSIFCQRAGDLLSTWLSHHGLDAVNLTVWMPCHRGFAQVTFTSAVQ